MPRAIVTGAAGFLGSHLCTKLVSNGWDVVGYDNLLTGDMDNLVHLERQERFSFVRHDVTEYINVDGDVDWVLHWASPASPIDYLQFPIQTMKVGSLGTWRALGVAKDKGAGFVLASTSEVYGDPQVHPQPESYWGHVNPVGPRGVYDEAKRYAEALSMAYQRQHGVRVKLVRIFNTYGPRMRRQDGRAVPTFMDQALGGLPLTVHGDGSQTRSLCYVDDLIEGIWRFVNSDLTGPVNIGNPREISVRELAEMVARIANSDSEVVFGERPIDDPEVRCPDISLAQNKLGWEPQVALENGLARTIDWARSAWF
ncbi:MAG: NAD-dependent epimerase/dehydratase family protein [Actinobacteria bacterium]|nr:NAD-dependent epimerase/dehydratase family protein [Actinomycetota bacterium]